MIFLGCQDLPVLREAEMDPTRVYNGCLLSALVVQYHWLSPHEKAGLVGNRSRGGKRRRRRKKEYEPDWLTEDTPGPGLGKDCQQKDLGETTLS